jgi:cysteinyl-tRNA synthetase
MRVWEGDYGEPMRTPMFWVPYENIRPYISRSFIMTSNYNNALTYTADDFFQLNMYEGDIIKTVNMMNQTLAQQFPDSAKLRNAQDSIERQLRDFESRLWLQRDTAKTVTEAKSKQEPKANARNTATRSSANTSASKSASGSNAKAATPKAPKASASPSRSVRRR